MRSIRSFQLTWVLSLALFLFACTPKGILFNQQAADTNKSIKDKSLALIDKSTESYTTHATEVDALKTEIDNEVAYETKRGKSNTPTIQMWDAIRKNESGTLYGLFDKWKSSDKLSSTFVQEVKPQIAKQFDILIGFEDYKVKK